MEGICAKNGLFLQLVVIASILTPTANCADRRQVSESPAVSISDGALAAYSVSASAATSANGESAGDKMAAVRPSPLFTPIMTSAEKNEDFDSRKKSTSPAASTAVTVVAAAANQRNDANPKRKNAKKHRAKRSANKGGAPPIDSDPETIGFPGGFPAADPCRDDDGRGKTGRENWKCGWISAAGASSERRPPGGVAVPTATRDGESAAGNLLPEDFFADVSESGRAQSAEKRNRIVEGFLGMRGKKAKNRKLIDGFLGMRGKKAPSVDAFYGMRGKKGADGGHFDYQAEGEAQDKRAPTDGFYGMRGKKWRTGSDAWLEEPEGWRGDAEWEKRIPEGFVGMRGKKWNRTGSDASLAETEEGAELEKRIPQGFVGMRGKKGDSGIDQRGSDPEDPTDFRMSKRALSADGYGARLLRHPSAVYRDSLVGGAFFPRARANLNDRKRQIGSIFIGMRG